MKKAALIVLVILVAAYVAAIFVPFDPVDRRPGTRLGGQLADIQNTDWSFLGAGRTQIYVESRSLYLIPHSITVSAWVTENVLYVGCGRCDGKYWPTNVARDQRVRLKVHDEIYERTAIRLDDDERRALFAKADSIIKVAAGEPLPDVAVFRMDPR